MADAKKETLDGSACLPDRPKVRTRWLDGSKYVDLQDLADSRVFRKTVREFQRIETHKPQ